MTETFLLTGSLGCIGAWTLRNLVDQGVNVIASDLSSDHSRPGLLLSDDELNDAITWMELDVTDLDGVRSAVEDNGVTNIIHLAGLQVPFCRANPSLGAAVNVVGTTNVFEAARHAGITNLAYASSIAVMGPASQYPDRPIADDVPLDPKTLYGVYKVANEKTAKVFWNDWQVPSVGLRPYNVYGVGRDQGMTADIAKAVLAAAAGRPFHIRFGGSQALQHANDVAQIFIAASRSGHKGAAACNLRNTVMDVADVVDLIKSEVPSAEITFDADTLLPFPADLDDSFLRTILGDVPHTPIADAIADDLQRFHTLLTGDKIRLSQLDE